MRLLLGKKSNRSLKQASASAPSSPPPLLTYPLPVLPPLVHVQTESYPTTPGKPVPSLGNSPESTPLRIHAMFSRSFSMNDVPLTGRPDQSTGPSTAIPMPRPARKEFLNREQEALLMQSRRKRGSEKDNQSKTSAPEHHMIESKPDITHPRRRKTYIGGQQDDNANTSDFRPALPSRYASSKTLDLDTTSPYLVNLSDRLDSDFDTENSAYFRRSASDPIRPASPPRSSSSLTSLPLGAAPAWKAARDAIVSRGHPDERQRISAVTPLAVNPNSSSWVVLETGSPTLSHSTSQSFHQPLASPTSSPNSSLLESDEAFSNSLRNIVRKKLSTLNVQKIPDESRPNTTMSFTRKSSANPIRRNILSARQKVPSASSNRDSGDSLEQAYFSSSSSTSSLEAGIETLADPFERRMILDSPIKTPSVYFQNF